VPGWEEYYTSTILVRLEDLKSPELPRQAQLIYIKLIVEMLETLRLHSILYQKLKEGTPLTLGKGFSGTCHCEVYIASLISQRHPGLDEFAVSHIFMLCSNVCPILQYRTVD
jgi:hypothetical protein